MIDSNVNIYIAFKNVKKLITGACDYHNQTIIVKRGSLGET